MNTSSFPFRSLFAACGTTLALVGPQHALAGGHGPALALEHFVRQAQPVQVQITKRTVAASAVLGVFELGNGSRLVVSKMQLPDTDFSQPFYWKPNKVLAFLE